ncbi:MAG: hypothetical protein QM742_19090 [Aquabacterium sp.]
MALRMIEPACRDPQVCGAGFLHIVVMTPGLTPQNALFEEAILHEHSLGDRTQWDADYAAFARAKARLSWETGVDGSIVQALQPHRLKSGDTLLWGAVCLDGIVVGVSGAYPWYDEAFATAIAANLRALCKARHAALLQANLNTAMSVSTGNADAGQEAA